MHSYGAQFCEVHVSARTGETRVSRFLGSFDAGQILNSKMATSQFKGGIIMGIGLALTEETNFDERTGRIVNASLADYHVPVQMDVPAIEILYTNKPDPKPPWVHAVSEKSASPELARPSPTRSTTRQAFASAICPLLWTN